MPQSPPIGVDAVTLGGGGFRFGALGAKLNDRASFPSMGVARHCVKSRDRGPAILTRLFKYIVLPTTLKINIRKAGNCRSPDLIESGKNVKLKNI